MELKTEYRSYKALRRMHDSEIVQIGMNAGLRFTPQQWSSLLYGESKHASYMQSITDKIQTSDKFGLHIFVSQ